MRNGTMGLVLTLLLLGACAPPTSSPPRLMPEPRAGQDFTCRSEGLDRFLGKLVNVDVAADILRASGARSLRWTGPGIAVTMDFRPDRVNLNLDETHHTIVSISCG